MRKFFILSLLCLQIGYGEQALVQYFSYVKQLGQSDGNYEKGEIEIIVDPVEISRVEKVQEDRLLQKGFSEEEARKFSRVGIVSEDQYWIWLRDAVYFPKGIPGTYDRLIWKNVLQASSPGVAVLPVLPSGKLVLNLNYRHATRSWELELPRGGMQPQETREAAALREIKEETGLVASTVTFLGEMTPDTGVLSSVVPVFLGKISAQGASDPEYSEAIADVLAFTKEELKQGLKRGFLEISVEGEKKQVPLRDSFLAFALLQLQLKFNGDDQEPVAEGVR